MYSNPGPAKGYLSGKVPERTAATADSLQSTGVHAQNGPPSGNIGSPTPSHNDEDQDDDEDHSTKGPTKKLRGPLEGKALTNSFWRTARTVLNKARSTSERSNAYCVVFLARPGGRLSYTYVSSKLKSCLQLHDRVKRLLHDMDRIVIKRVTKAFEKNANSEADIEDSMDLGQHQEINRLFQEGGSQDIFAFDSVEDQFGEQPFLPLLNNPCYLGPQHLGQELRSMGLDQHQAIDGLFREGGSRDIFAFDSVEDQLGEPPFPPLLNDPCHLGPQHLAQELRPSLGAEQVLDNTRHELLSGFGPAVPPRAAEMSLQHGEAIPTLHMSHSAELGGVFQSQFPEQVDEINEFIQGGARETGSPPFYNGFPYAVPTSIAASSDVTIATPSPQRLLSSTSTEGLAGDLRGSLGRRLEMSAIDGVGIPVHKLVTSLEWLNNEGGSGDAVQLCDTVYSLRLQPKLKDEFIHRGGPRALVSLLKRSKELEQWRLPVLRAVDSILPTCDPTQESTESETSINRCFYYADIVQATLDLLHDSNEPRISMYAAYIVGKMARCKLATQDMQSLSLVQWLTRLIEHGPQTVIHAAALAISNITVNLRSRKQQFIEAGIAPHLVRRLSGSDSREAKAVARTIRVLATAYEEGRQAFFATNVADELVRLSRSTDDSVVKAAVDAIDAIVQDSSIRAQAFFQKLPESPSSRVMGHQAGFVKPSGPVPQEMTADSYWTPGRTAYPRSWL